MKTPEFLSAHPNGHAVMSQSTGPSDGHLRHDPALPIPIIPQIHMSRALGGRGSCPSQQATAY